MRLQFRVEMQFAKAITNLWKQNYFSDVEIYVTKLQGQDIFLEIAVTESPRLGAPLILKEFVKVKQKN
jgi:hypothetical protein